MFVCSNSWCYKGIFSSGFFNNLFTYWYSYIRLLARCLFLKYPNSRFVIFNGTIHSSKYTYSFQPFFSTLTTFSKINVIHMFLPGCDNLSFLHSLCVERFLVFSRCIKRLDKHTHCCLNVFAILRLYAWINVKLSQKYATDDYDI